MHLPAALAILEATLALEGWESIGSSELEECVKAALALGGPPLRLTWPLNPKSSVRAVFMLDFADPLSLFC